MSTEAVRGSTSERRHEVLMPAEWEPQRAVWVCAPDNEQTWPGCLDEAQMQHANLLEVLRPFIQVRHVRDLGVHPYDAWVRDYGPIFVKDCRHGNVSCQDFVFNAWGGKYEAWERDDDVCQAMAPYLDHPIRRHPMVLEGGSIDVNGSGALLTTEQCLLNRNRNPTMSRAQIEDQLQEILGEDHILWLPSGLEGDDTDGHVDQVARFIHPDVVVAVRAPTQHCDHRRLESNWQVLQQQSLNLIELPIPEPVHGIHREQLPASYANFLITNGAVVVPIFGQTTDDQALQILDDAMPDHKIIGVRCEHLLVGLGTVHCLTMQEPI